MVTSCLGNCLLESVIKGKMEVKERRERRCKQLLDDDKKKRKWDLKEKTLDRIFWRNCCQRSYGTEARENTWWLNFSTFTTAHPIDHVIRLFRGWSGSVPAQYTDWPWHFSSQLMKAEGARPSRRINFAQRHQIILALITELALCLTSST